MPIRPSLELREPFREICMARSRTSAPVHPHKFDRLKDEVSKTDERTGLSA